MIGRLIVMFRAKYSSDLVVLVVVCVIIGYVLVESGFGCVMVDNWLGHGRKLVVVSW